MRSLALLVFTAGVAVVLSPAGCGGAVYNDGTHAGGDDAGGDERIVVRDSGHHDGQTDDSGDSDVEAEASTGDDGPIACDLGVCPSPADVSTFQPTWIPPTGSHQNACTAQLLDDFYTGCLSTNGPQSCSDFGPGGDAAHQACGKCLQSQFTDSQWGPLVYARDDVETNTAGCIALLDPSQTACAKAIESVAECEHAACDAICGAGGSGGFDQYVQCTAASNTCGCKSYFDASQCQKAIAAGGGPATPCLVGQTFEDFYYATAAVFCGP
jgi:hypothetical protein